MQGKSYDSGMVFDRPLSMPFSAVLGFLVMVFLVAAVAFRFNIAKLEILGLIREVTEPIKMVLIFGNKIAKIYTYISLALYTYISFVLFPSQISLSSTIYFRDSLNLIHTFSFPLVFLGLLMFHQINLLMIFFKI